MPRHSSQTHMGTTNTTHKNTTVDAANQSVNNARVTTGASSLAAASGLAIIGGNQIRSAAGPFKPFGYQSATNSNAKMGEMNHYGYMTGGHAEGGSNSAMRSRIGGPNVHNAFGTTFKQKTNVPYTSSSMRPHAKSDRLQLNLNPNLQANSKLPTLTNSKVTAATMLTDEPIQKDEIGSLQSRLLDKKSIAAITEAHSTSLIMQHMPLPVHTAQQKNRLYLQQSRAASQQQMRLNHQDSEKSFPVGNFTFMPGHSMLQQGRATESNFLIHKHNICKEENKMRLKEVKNLEDLIRFQVRTVADDLQLQADKDELGLQQQSSVDALRQMCDPLLAGRANPNIMKKYPKLLDRKLKQKQAQAQETDRSAPVPNNYEIPAELLELKRNYNLIDQSKPQPGVSKKKESIKITAENGFKKIVEELIPQKSVTLERQDSFSKASEIFKAAQTSADRLKMERIEEDRAREELLRRTMPTQQKDPVKLLRSYFDNRQEAKNIVNANELKKVKPMTTPSTGLMVGATHENFIISKYERLIRAGKIKTDWSETTGANTGAEDSPDQQDGDEMSQEQFAKEKLRLLEGILRQQGLVTDAPEKTLAKDETLPTQLGGRSTDLTDRKPSLDQSIGVASFQIPRYNGYIENETPSPRPQDFSIESPPKISSNLSGLQKMRDELLAIFNDEERQWDNAKAEGITGETARPIETVITRSLENSDSILQPTTDGFVQSNLAFMPPMRTNKLPNMNTGQVQGTQLLSEQSVLDSLIQNKVPQKAYKEDQLSSDSNIASLHQFSQANSRVYGILESGEGIATVDDDKAQSTSTGTGLRKSELLKVAGVGAEHSKSNAPVGSNIKRDYVPYSKYQLEVAEKLKSMEQRQKEEGKPKRSGTVTKLTDSSLISQKSPVIITEEHTFVPETKPISNVKSPQKHATKVHIEARRNSASSVEIEQDRTSRSPVVIRRKKEKNSLTNYMWNGVSVNLAASASNIKAQIERGQKKHATVVQPTKYFKEDNNARQEPYNFIADLLQSQRPADGVNTKNSTLEIVNEMQRSSHFAVGSNGEIAIINEKVALPGPPEKPMGYDDDIQEKNRDLIKSQGFKQHVREFHQYNERGSDGSETKIAINMSSQNTSKRRIRTSAQKLYRSQQSGSQQDGIHIYRTGVNDFAEGVNTVPLTTEGQVGPKIQEALRGSAERSRSSRRSIYSRQNKTTKSQNKQEVLSSQKIRQSKVAGKEPESDHKGTKRGDQSPDFTQVNQNSKRELSRPDDSSRAKQALNELSSQRVGTGGIMIGEILGAALEETNMQGAYGEASASEVRKNSDATVPFEESAYTDKPQVKVTERAARTAYLKTTNMQFNAPHQKSPTRYGKSRIVDNTQSGPSAANKQETIYSNDEQDTPGIKYAPSKSPDRNDQNTSLVEPETAAILAGGPQFTGASELHTRAGDRTGPLRYATQVDVSLAQRKTSIEHDKSLQETTSTRMRNTTTLMAEKQQLPMAKYDVDRNNDLMKLHRLPNGNQVRDVRINRRTAVAPKRGAKKGQQKAAEASGYNTAGEAFSDQVSAEMYEQILREHFNRRNQWMPSRYKKFPRFTIYTCGKRHDQDTAGILGQHCISLTHVLAQLAGADKDKDDYKPITQLLQDRGFSRRSSQPRPSRSKMNASSSPGYSGLLQSGMLPRAEEEALAAEQLNGLIFLNEDEAGAERSNVDPYQPMKNASGNVSVDPELTSNRRLDRANTQNSLPASLHRDDVGQTAVLVSPESHDKGRGMSRQSHRKGPPSQLEIKRIVNASPTPKKKSGEGMKQTIPIKSRAPINNELGISSNGGQTSHGAPQVTTIASRLAEPKKFED